MFNKAQSIFCHERKKTKFNASGQWKTTITLKQVMNIAVTAH